MADNRLHGSRVALVAYASETGNSQDVASELGDILERLRFNVRVCDLDSVDAATLHSYAISIFAVSTTGQGDFAANGRSFWKSILLKKLPSTYLQGVNFALFGLGDSSYPKFNWASRKLRKRLIQLGADESYPVGEADEQHPEGLEGTFLPWSLGLRKRLLDNFPLEPGQDPVPDDVRLPPKWVLSHQNAPANGNGSLDEGPDRQRTGPETKMRNHELNGFGHDLRPIPDTVEASLAENTRVTSSTHWQDVRHLKFDIAEHISYIPGDILSITPKNFATDVNSLISLMSWEDVADAPLRFEPMDSTLSQPTVPFLLEHPGFTLRTLLTDYLDIMSIPRRSFFSQIAHFSDNPTHQERLLEFVVPEYIDEFHDYATRSRRSILEVLYEFDSVKIPWQQVCNVFPALRARQFSIASGGKLKRTGDGNTRVDLLVAIVKYQTVIKKIREGVCTRYLAVLQPGATLKVQVQRGGLKPSTKQLAEPCVLIGPGTGVAPLRSVLWEKAAMAQAFRQKHGPELPVPMGPIVLLFGGRNRASDFFFETEWEALKDILDLTVLSAFSRDQREKIYVQDLIRGQSGLFFRILHDLHGTVFICGSSGRMPQAIREALIECFQNSEGDSASREAAEKYLLDMEKVGRYRQETW